MIDWTRLEDLRTDLDEACLGAILHSFLHETAATLRALTECADPDPVAQRHLLKGTALTMGFAALAQACDAKEPPDRLQAVFDQSRARFLDGLADRGLAPASQISTSVST